MAPKDWDTVTQILTNGGNPSLPNTNTGTQTTQRGGNGITNTNFGLQNVQKGNNSSSRKK